MAAETANPQSVVAPGKPSRADVIAGMGKLEAHPDDASAAVVDPPKDGETDPAKPVDPPAEEQPKDPTEDPAKPDDEKPADPLEAKDPETDKRLGVIAKAEKRSRDALATRAAEIRGEFDREKAAWAPQIKAAQEFEALKAKVRSNPVAVLRQLGLSDDDFDYTARQIYGFSKQASADPKNRQAVEASRAQREQEQRFDDMAKRLDAFETAQRQREQQASTEQQKARYIGDVSKAITGESAPFLRRLLDKSPDKAQLVMWQMAEQLYNETGELPDAADIGATYEKQRRAELEELGIDPQAILKPTKQAATANTPSRTLDTANGAATKPVNGKPATRTDILRDMPWRE